jgi:CheY-like chemotaxis protein
MERRMLEEEGFQVTATAAADDALRRLAEETYDCLVTDLEMPGMDGFELTRHVRSTPRLAQLPIVVVSTRDEPGDRLAGLEAGADAYVTKQTLEARKLAQILRRVGSRG